MSSARTAIVDAFEQLLEEKPLNKITVKDIVERCGVNRNTFYYHFQDIPSLLDEAIVERTNEMIRNHAKPGSPVDCFCPFLEYCENHKQTVLHIYHSIQPDRYLSYLDQIATCMVQEYADHVTKGSNISAEDSQLIVRYYKCTVVGLLLDWLEAGMQYDLNKAVFRLCELFDGSGQQAFLRAIESQTGKASIKLGKISEA